MDSDHKEELYLQRAKNEWELATVIFKLSNETDLKTTFALKPDTTFFSNVISGSYYCIFYAGKALLAQKGITTEPPSEHKKTLDYFEKLTYSGEIDKELLFIYKKVLVRADELLGIFRNEKKKRGEFTYQKLPQANREPAQESLVNAEKFLKNINLMLLATKRKTQKKLAHDSGGVAPFGLPSRAKPVVPPKEKNAGLK